MKANIQTKTAGIFLILIFFCTMITSAHPWMGNLTQVNYHKSAKNGKLKITFLEIVSDNRCPLGTKCITAGTANISIKIASKKYEIAIGKYVQVKHKNHTYQIQLIDLKPALEKEVTFKKENSFIYLQITSI